MFKTKLRGTVAGAAILAAATTTAFGLMAATTSTPAQAGVCPSIYDSAYSVTTSDCNILLTINSNGTVSSSNPSGTPNYDSSEDVLVGILNNTAQTLSSFAISGASIFNFDGDGICQTARFSGANCTGVPSTGNGTYAPFGVSFSIANINSGIVSVAGGIGTGQSFYFSLEEPTGLAGITLTAVPEPTTLSLFGAALLGLGLALRRRQA